MWICYFLEDIGLKQQAYLLFCDSKNAILVVNNIVYHARTKHIHIRSLYTESVG